jgi:hypothetical protein
MSFEAIKELVEKIKEDHHRHLYEMCKKECSASGFLNMQQIEVIFNNQNQITHQSEINNGDSPTVKKNNQDSDLFSLDHEKLLKLTVPELKAYSKKYGLKVTGKRDELLNRLILHKNGGNAIESATESATETSKLTKSKESKKPKKSPENKLLSKIKKDLSSLEIRKNEFGNYMHEESKLIFDKETKSVIGTQGDDGKINKLTLKDVENCNRFNFDYNMPDNLEENSDSLQDVKVNELDEDFTEAELKVGEDSDEDEFEEFYEDDE